MIRLVGSIDLEKTGTCMALASDGSVMAIADMAGYINILSLPDLMPTTSFPGHPEGTNCIAFTQSTHCLVSGGDGAVRLRRGPGWEVTREIGQFVGRSVWVFQLCVTGDERYLCAIGHDEPDLLSPSSQSIVGNGSGPFRYLRLWQFATGELLAEIDREWTMPFASLTASPDGSMIVVADPLAVTLLSVPEAKRIKTLEKSQMAHRCLTISPDGRFLACASKDGYVLIYTLPDGNLYTTLSAHNDSVISVAFSPDSKVLASGSFDMIIRTWRMPEGEELDWKPSYPIVGGDLAFSSDGSLLFCMGSSAGMLKEAKSQIQVYCT